MYFAIVLLYYFSGVNEYSFTCKLGHARDLFHHPFVQRESRDKFSKYYSWVAMKVR